MVNSVKHFVPLTKTAVATGAINRHIIVDAITKGLDRTATNQVDEGTQVKAVYVEVWIDGQGASNANTQFVFIISKEPSGAAAPTAAEMLNLQSYANKKNILYTSQGVIGGIQAQSVPIHRGWIAIPKGKQRMGLGDQISFTIAPVGTELDICSMNVYKEYY